jgi:hypothetical protein
MDWVQRTLDRTSYSRLCPTFIFEFKMNSTYWGERWHNPCPEWDSNSKCIRLLNWQLSTLDSEVSSFQPWPDCRLCWIWVIFFSLSRSLSWKIVFFTLTCHDHRVSYTDLLHSREHLVLFDERYPVKIKVLQSERFQTLRALEHASIGMDTASCYLGLLSHLLHSKQWQSWPWLGKLVCENSQVTVTLNINSVTSVCVYSVW